MEKSSPSIYRDVHVQTDQTEEFMFQNVAYRVYNIDQLYIKLGQKVVMDDNIFDVSKLCWN